MNYNLKICVKSNCHIIFVYQTIKCVLIGFLQDISKILLCFFCIFKAFQSIDTCKSEKI